MIRVSAMNPGPQLKMECCLLLNKSSETSGLTLLDAYPAVQSKRSLIYNEYTLFVASSPFCSSSVKNRWYSTMRHNIRKFSKQLEKLAKSPTSVVHVDAPSEVAIDSLSSGERLADTGSQRRRRPRSKSAGSSNADGSGCGTARGDGGDSSLQRLYDLSHLLPRGSSAKPPAEVAAAVAPAFAQLPPCVTSVLQRRGGTGLLAKATAAFAATESSSTERRHALELARGAGAVPLISSSGEPDSTDTVAASEASGPLNRQCPPASDSSTTRASRSRAAGEKRRRPDVEGSSSFVVEGGDELPQAMALPWNRTSRLAPQKIQESTGSFGLRSTRSRAANMCQPLQLRLQHSVLLTDIHPESVEGDPTLGNHGLGSAPSLSLSGPMSTNRGPHQGFFNSPNAVDSSSPAGSGRPHAFPSRASGDAGPSAALPSWQGAGTRDARSRANTGNVMTESLPGSGAAFKRRPQLSICVSAVPPAHPSLPTPLSVGGTAASAGSGLPLPLPSMAMAPHNDHDKYIVPPLTMAMQGHTGDLAVSNRPSGPAAGFFQLPQTSPCASLQSSLPQTFSLVSSMQPHKPVSHATAAAQQPYAVSPKGSCSAVSAGAGSGSPAMIQAPAGPALQGGARPTYHRAINASAAFPSPVPNATTSTTTFPPQSPGSHWQALRDWSSEPPLSLGLRPLASLGEVAPADHGPRSGGRDARGGRAGGGAQRFVFDERPAGTVPVGAADATSTSLATALA